METYLYKFSACLAIFWLVYVLILERQKMHRIKRFYLLGAFAAALIIPVLTITHYIEPVVTSFKMSPLFMPLESSVTERPQVQAPFMDLETMLWIVYGLGVLLFSIRFTVNLFKMYKRVSDHKNVSERSFIYVLLEDYRIPHSFFKYIFLNKLNYEKNAIPKEVLLHEETHAKQMHSLDIIVIELLQIVFWFHPLIYILKHHIKLNHEFLADQAVLENGVDTKTYQTILLQFSSNTAEYQLSSAINYSSIKKRFTVMKTQTSKTRIWASSLLLLPIIAILFYSFAEREYVEKENNKISEAIATELEKANDLQVIYQDGATEAMMKEYNDWVKPLNNSSSRVIPLGKFERIVAIYDLMSEVQRNSIEPYPFFLNTNVYKEEPSIPTTAQFESWKNEKEFAIWLDGKHISNSELNNYKINDIAHYSGSNIHSNAQRKKFTQPFQFSLYTKDGFKKFYTESFVSDYRALTKTYSNAINNYLKGSKTDNSELRIIKAQADKFYNQFTKEDLDTYNILPAPRVPAGNQQKATAKEVADYNTWAKQLNTSENKIIKKKDLETYRYIYSIMTAEQKKASESFPKLPPPPPKLENSKSIKPVEILIKKDNKLVLNGKPIAFKDLANSVNEINKNLTIEERRNYVMASIIIERDESIDFAEKIQSELRKAEVWSSHIGYGESQQKLGLATKHYSPNAGLTITEAKAQQELALQEQEQALKDSNVSQQNKKDDEKSPWAIEMEVNTVEIVETNNSQFKSGPIEINGATYYFTQQNGKTTYYDHYGKIVDINQIPPPPPISTHATPEKKAEMQKATEAYKKAKLDKGETPDELTGSTEINGEKLYYVSKNSKTTYFNRDGKEVKMDNLPPPPPTKNPSFLEFIIDMEKQGASFYLDDKKITAEQAKIIAKNNKGKGTEMVTQLDDDGKYVLKFSSPRKNKL